MSPPQRTIQEQLDEGASNAPSAAQTTPAEPDTRWEKIAQNLKTIGGAVLLALAIRTCLFEPFEIEGPSMEPTLLNGDRVVVAKFPYGLFLPLRDEAEITWGSPEPGQVVIIKSPADGIDIVKRVIGVGGDLIEVRGDRVFRNGKPLPRIDRGPCSSGVGAGFPRCRVYESKVAGQTFLTSSAFSRGSHPPMHVPQGHIFVLGDHRDQSNDSRNPSLGAIPIDRVKGRALSIYWSREGAMRWHRMLKAVQ